ncbi:unnamed protein product, partial [Medioppia subpectinata]
MEDEDLEEMKYLREQYKRMEAVDNKKITGYKFDLNSVNKKSQTFPKLLKQRDDTFA